MPPSDNPPTNRKNVRFKEKCTCAGCKKQVMSDLKFNERLT